MFLTIVLFQMTPDLSDVYTEINSTIQDMVFIDETTKQNLNTTVTTPININATEISDTVCTYDQYAVTNLTVLFIRLSIMY